MKLQIAVLVGVGVGTATVAQAAVHKVGPGQPFAEVADVVDQLAPGDTVEIYGGKTYQPFDHTAAGTAGQPIRFLGVSVGGQRPVVAGGDYTIMLRGNHVILENVEVTGGSAVCVLHKADDVTIRNVVIHDCAGHGVLGTDGDSGSLTITRSEVYATGEGDRKHQVYVATDESVYPGSVFRLEHTWIHDGNGGNNVKSRAERTEIYYNWIEEAFYHELDIIGPDGQDEDLAREDADIVGNVFVKRSSSQIGRIGGDGTGQTNGRYRFAWNTMVLAGSDVVLRAQDGLDSIELHNNVIVRAGGGAVRLVSDSSASWASGTAVIGGSGNWLPTGTDPLGTTGNVLGNDPGFVDLASGDLRPDDGSPLIDGAVAQTPSPGGHDFPGGASVPLFLPTHGIADAPVPRPAVGTLDSGALEFGSGPPVVDDGTPDGTDAGPDDGTDAGPGDDGDGTDAGNDDGDGDGAGPGIDHVNVGCSATGAASGDLLSLLGVLGVAGVLARRRRRA